MQHFYLGEDKEYHVFIHERASAVEQHDHDFFYELYLTETGGIIHSVNGKEYILPQGALSFIRPSDVHSIHCQKDGVYRHINLSFTKNIFDRLMAYLDNATLRDSLLNTQYPPVVILNSEDRWSLYKKIQRISFLDEIDKSEAKMYMLRVLLEAFTTHFCNFAHAENEDIPIWLRYAMQEMQNPANLEGGVRRMTALCGRSINHLERSMKKYVGVRPREYVNHLRIQYAASLLKRSDVNILDIAYECGFESAAYFYKLFKEQMDVSPKTYRQRYRG